MEKKIIKRTFFRIEKYDKGLKVTASFPVEIKKNTKTGQFVCHSPLFTAIGYGENEQEAQMNFTYSLEDIIYGMITSGRLKLNKWMKQMGWTLKENMMKNKEFDKFELTEINETLPKNLEIFTQSNDFAESAYI